MQNYVSQFIIQFTYIQVNSFKTPIGILTKNHISIIYFLIECDG